MKANVLPSVSVFRDEIDRQQLGDKEKSPILRRRGVKEKKIDSGHLGPKQIFFAWVRNHVTFFRRGLADFSNRARCIDHTA